LKQITRKDGISYQRKEPRDIKSIPSKEQYIQTLNKLATEGYKECYIAVRLGCEMGLPRLDIVNLEVNNINRFHPRGLWVEVSKRVNKGTRKKPKYEMRSREVPINQNLYAFLMAYVDPKTKYILKKKKGDVMKPYDVQYINELYDEAKVPWSPHKARHYFRTEVKGWMREKRTMDEELVNEYMGHATKGVPAMYGTIKWEYKIDIVDKVFA